MCHMFTCGGQSLILNLAWNYGSFINWLQAFEVLELHLSTKASDLGKNYTDLHSVYSFLVEFVISQILRHHYTLNWLNSIGSDHQWNLNYTITLDYNHPLTDTNITTTKIASSHLESNSLAQNSIALIGINLNFADYVWHLSPSNCWSHHIRL